MKWKRGTFKIAVNPSCRHEVKDERSGLILANLFGVAENRVTHLPTGKAISSWFATQREAKQCAEQLLPLADWSKLTLENETSFFEPIREQVKALIVTQ